MHKRKQSDISWSAVDASPLQYLISPENLDGFFAKVWEKRAKLYKADSSRQKLFPELGSLGFLKTLLDPKRNEQLEFGVDLNAARYTNGVRQTPNGEVADMRTVMELYRKGCTLQLHQPQRWNPELWRLIAAMEKQLGCLVGANAYLTPAGTQGLAPHYDDVDLWVCQTEGSKRWLIYDSPEGYVLPAVSSKDFQQSAIGQPIMDVTLQVGDVLFMPRGTIHQAKAQEEASCHMTISTYQKWALADFAQAVIAELQGGQPAAQGNKATPGLPQSLRHGLPLAFLSSAGLQRNVLSSAARESIHPVAAQTAKGLRDLADSLEKSEDLTSLAADRLAIDFLQSRAPPHPDQLPKKGPAPSISSHVRSMGSSYFRLLPCSPSPEVMEAYEGEPSFVSVLSCLKNRIETHMIGGKPGGDDGSESGSGSEGGDEDLEGRPAKRGKPSQGAGDESESEAEDASSLDEKDSEHDLESDSDEEGGGALVFPASYSTALAQLLQADKPIAVKDLRLRNKEEKVGLAYSLWAEGIVCTAVDKKHASPSKKQKR